MSLPRYAEYKDGGVAWLGDIPSHWEVPKFRHAFIESSEKIDSEVVGVMLSVSGYRGIEIKEYDDENRRRLDEDLVGYRIVRPGQLVVNTMWLNYAGLGVSDFEGHVSPAYRSYWIAPEFNRRYVHHMMRCDSFVRGYTKFLTGIRPNSLQMSREDLMSFQLLRPPRDEQAVIAAFLDRETAKIDALISEQERLIALLAEKREAAISHAVTRGLDADTPMKDSGVAWLGNVPAHWDIKRVKHLVRESIAGPYGSSLTKSMYVASGFRVYGQQQVIPQDFSVGDYYISTEKFCEMSRYRVAPDDVLISVMGTIGRAAVVPEDVEPGIINPRLVLYRVVERLIFPRYLQTFLNNSTSQRYFSLAAQGTTMEGLNMSSIGELYVALPPPKEQLEILKFVQLEGETLDALSAAAERAIILLKERRSALIVAAVTGQVDVRGSVNRPAEIREELTA